MLVVLYQFTVKDGCNKDFEKNWAVVTDAIKQHRGSLGSRLHTTEHPNTYIAYAQWPSLEVLESGNGGELFTEVENQAMKDMKEACDKIETLHRMHVCDDRLVA